MTHRHRKLCLSLSSSFTSVSDHFRQEHVGRSPGAPAAVATMPRKLILGGLPETAGYLMKSKRVVRRTAQVVERGEGGTRAGKHNALIATSRHGRRCLVQFEPSYASFEFL